MEGAGAAPKQPGGPGYRMTSEGLEVDIRPRTAAVASYGALPRLPPLARNPLSGGDDADEIVARANRENALAKIDETFPKFGDVAGLSLMGLGPPMAYAQTMPVRSTKKPQAGSDDVRSLQEELKRSGYYTGPIDGVMGEATSKAAAKRQQDEAAKGQQDLERQQAGAQQATAEARARELQLQKALADRKAAEREAGNQRFQDMEKNTSPVSKFIRDYSVPIGAALGFGAGVAGRMGAVKTSNMFASRRAEAGDRTMQNAPAGSPPVTQADLGPRAGAVNDFWRQGQRSPNPAVPYEVTPNTAPGIRANVDPPPAAALYQPNRLANIATDTAIPAAGMAEWYLVDKGMVEPARAEMSAAFQAAEGDPSEVNLTRLQKAIDNLAFSQGLSNFGRGVAGGYLSTALKVRRDPTSPSRTPTAEAEQMAVNDYLRQYLAGPPGGGPNNPAAQQVAQALQRLSHAHFQPRNKGRFAGPPQYPPGHPRHQP